MPSRQTDPEVIVQGEAQPRVETARGGYGVAAQERRRLTDKAAALQVDRVEALPRIRRDAAPIFATVPGIAIDHGRLGMLGKRVHRGGNCAVKVGIVRVQKGEDLTAGALETAVDR